MRATSRPFTVTVSTTALRLARYFNTDARSWMNVQDCYELKLEARRDELRERLATAPADIPDIHPNVAGLCRRKVERLAEALRDPRERDEAAEAVRGLVERVVLAPGAKRGGMDAALYGDLGAVLEWTAKGAKGNETDTPSSGMSVSVVAGAGFEPATFRL